MNNDSSNQASAYLKTKVFTASPAELRLMLLDGAIKFAEQAREGLTRQDPEAVFNGITRCQDILMELINALDARHAPDLCEKLSALYTFMYTRLIMANSDQDIRKVEEVIELLRYERETWSMVIDRLAEENAAAGMLPATMRLDESQPGSVTADPGGAASGLVGGRVSVSG